METAHKISGNTALRSSSVPKWIQQFRTHKLKEPSKEYLSIFFCTEPSQFSAPALQGSPISQGATANTTNALWVYLARPFWSQILPSCTVSMDRKVLYNTRRGLLSFLLKKSPVFLSFSFFFLSLLSHHQPFCKHLHLYDKETKIKMKFWFSMLHS